MSNRPHNIRQFIEQVNKIADAPVAVTGALTPQQCDQCGEVAELRPFGPGGSLICFDCGRLDIKGTEARMRELMDSGDIL